MRGIHACRLSVLLLILIAAPVLGAAGSIKGSLTVGTGYLDHPLGRQDEPSAGYLSQAWNVSTLFGENLDALKLGYEGSASQFSKETPLGSMRHGIGVEWFRNSEDRLRGLSAGLQFAFRDYESYYEIYNYSEAYSYLAFKRYFGQIGRASCRERV